VNQSDFHTLEGIALQATKRFTNSLQASLSFAMKFVLPWRYSPGSRSISIRIAPMLLGYNERILANSKPMQRPSGAHPSAFLEEAIYPFPSLLSSPPRHLTGRQFGNLCNNLSFTCSCSRHKPASLCVSLFLSAYAPQASAKSGSILETERSTAWAANHFRTIFPSYFFQFPPASWLSTSEILTPVLLSNWMI